MAESWILLILPAALIAAGMFDVGTLTIPNPLNACLALAFFPAALFVGMEWSVMGLHVLAGVLMLFLGILLFSFGNFGGGDAKLLAATALWIGWGDLGVFLVVSALSGGVVALAFLFLRKLPLPGFLCRQAWVVRLHNAGNGIPYGLALCAGGLFAFQQSYWTGLAVQAPFLSAF